MADTRSDSDKAAGLIPIIWDGKVIRMRTLKRRAAAEWRGDVGGRVRSLVGSDLSVDSLTARLSDASDLVLDALLAYDQAGVLGKRAEIEENVDDALIYGALVEVLKVAFPMVADLRGAIREIGSLMAMGGGTLPQPTSTNGASPTGDLIPTS
jgi:hypothetical protein